MSYKVKKKKHAPPKYLAHERERLQKKKENKSFISKNFPLKRVLKICLYPIGALISAVTFFAFFYIQFAETSNMYELAVGLSLFLAIGQEIGKYFLADATMEGINDQDYEGTPYEVRSFVSVALGMFLVFSISIIISLKGAPYVASHFKKQQAPIELVNIDDINTRYDEKVAIAQRQVEAGKKSTWRGVTTQSGLKIIGAAQKQINDIETQRVLEIAKAEAENKKRQLAYDEKIGQTQSYFLGIAGVGELICLICMFFFSNYEKGAEEELDTLSPYPIGEEVRPHFDLSKMQTLIEEAVQKSLPSPPPVGHVTLPKAKQQIGFFQSPKTEIDSQPYQQSPNVVHQSQTTGGQKEITIADIKYWKSCVTKYYERSQEEWKPNSKEETLRKNWDRHLEYIKKLEAIPNRSFEFKETERDGKPSIEVIEKEVSND